MTGLSKKGWLKKAIALHLFSTDTSPLKDYRHPDEPVYQLVRPTGSMNDIPADDLDLRKRLTMAEIFKIQLVGGIVNIYKISQVHPGEYDAERCMCCLYTFYKGIFPALAPAGRNWLGRPKSLLSACEFILDKRLVSCQASNNVQSGVSFAESLRYKKPYVAMAMRVFCALTFHKIYSRLARHLRLDMTLAKLVNVGRNIAGASFFDNAQLFIDVYLFRLYCTAEGDEVLLEYLRQQREEIALTALKVITAAAHVNDSIAPGARELFELFIKNSTFTEEKKRIAYKCFVHGISAQEIMVEGPSSWVLKKFFLELAILTSWSDNVFDEKELRFINDFGDMLELKGMDKDLSMLAVEGFLLDARYNRHDSTGEPPGEMLEASFMKRLSNLLLAHENEVIDKIKQDGDLVHLLQKASVPGLTPDQKEIVHDRLLMAIESLPMCRANKLPAKFLTYKRLSAVLPKKIASRVIT